MDKKIDVVELPVSALKDSIGNPRKITPRKKLELQQSLEQFGDFGIIVIDDDNNIISGHQRVQALIASQGEDATVLCKRLVGYTKPELKAINIRANTHAGEWDLSKLAEWTADLQVPLGLSLPEKNPSDELKVKKMELVRFEKYDYVIIACRTEYDYNALVNALGIDGETITISKCKNGERKIKARAIWYDQMKAKIIPKDV